MYTLKFRIKWTLIAIVLGVLFAGLWNYKVVDGLGHNIIAGKTIGETSLLAESFSQNGFGFGFLFAAIAGLAATFTACNCVVFALIPGLTCSAKISKLQILKLLAIFVIGVLFVSFWYGIFVGSLGHQGAVIYNLRQNRLLQAQVVFSLLGGFMLLWGMFSMGLFQFLVHRIPEKIRLFFSRLTTKAAILGVMVGLFAVGRPFPVFRDFLTYAATAQNPLYGASVMMIQGLGQITVMIVATIGLVFFFGKKLNRWIIKKPQQPALISSFALILGGTYFLYYWGLSFLFNIGSWGFKLGWYK